MVVFINGSFGVGKTTVARLLRGSLAGSVVYDPELVGIALMLLSRWTTFKRTADADFQDFSVWRRSAVAGVRLFRLLFSGPVIVPMTFSRREYFDEVVAGVRRFDPEVRVFCLKASLPTVKKRLAGRETDSEGRGADWLARRIAECAEAHRDPHFGEPVETEDRPAREVCADIFNRLQAASF